MPDGICARCERAAPVEMVSGGMLGKYLVEARLCRSCRFELGPHPGAVLWIRSIYVLLLQRRAAGPGTP